MSQQLQQPLLLLQKMLQLKLRLLTQMTQYLELNLQMLQKTHQQPLLQRPQLN